MIPNVTKGSKPVGLMKYLIGPGKENEHTDPHLIAGSPTVMAWFDDAQLNQDSAVTIASELDLNRRTFGTDLQKHIWHCSLSLRADEQLVTDQTWGDIAEQFMSDMEFAGDEAKAPCQWVAVHHGKSANGNDHIHIVASRVREDGTKWHDGADFARVQKAARKVEKDHGFLRLGEYSQRGYKPAEKKDQREPARFRIERLARACAVAAEDEGQFVRRMRKSGLLVRARFADGTDSVVSGYSLAERPPGGMKPVWFGGGRLAKDLTLPSLRSRWADDPRQAQNAVDEWWAAKRNHRIAHPDADRNSAAGTGNSAMDEDAARQLAGELAEVRRKLVSVAPDDRQTWAHVAREASGVFGAWSKTTEAQPGPLAHTSRVLARSSHRSGMKIKDPIDPPLRMSGTTSFLLAAGSNSPIAQALVMQQMVRMVRSLHDMHKADHELREASMLADTVQQQLAHVAAPLPDVPQTTKTVENAHNGPIEHRGVMRETPRPTATPQRPNNENESTAGMER